MAPLQWLLICAILAFDLIALIVIARSPQESGQENSFKPALNEDQFPEVSNRIRQVVSRPKRIPKPFLGVPKMQLNSFRRKGVHIHRKHRLHHRHYAFLLRCPQPPHENPEDTSTKIQIGVEFSHNSIPLIRILSDGRRFESDEITAVEEWKTVHNRLNIVAHGPRGESRYKFEFDEAKGWFAVRITNLKAIDVGLWQCRAQLRHKNGTVQQFDSRKTIRLGDVPTEAPRTTVTAVDGSVIPIVMETTTEMPKIVETTTVDLAVEMGFIAGVREDKRKEEANVVSYSDAPLFSFAKTIGDPMFSRVDRRRNVFIAYVRNDDDSAEAKPKRPSRKRQRTVSSSSTINTLSLFLLIVCIVFYRL